MCKDGQSFRVQNGSIVLIKSALYGTQLLRGEKLFFWAFFMYLFRFYVELLWLDWINVGVVFRFIIDTMKEKVMWNAGCWWFFSFHFQSPTWTTFEDLPPPCMFPGSDTPLLVTSMIMIKELTRVSEQGKKKPTKKLTTDCRIEKRCTFPSLCARRRRCQDVCCVCGRGEKSAPSVIPQAEITLFQLWRIRSFVHSGVWWDRGNQEAAADWISSNVCSKIKAVLCAVRLRSSIRLSPGLIYRQNSKVHSLGRRKCICLSRIKIELQIYERKENVHLVEIWK